MYEPQVPLAADDLGPPDQSSDWVKLSEAAAITGIDANVLYQRARFGKEFVPEDVYRNEAAVQAGIRAPYWVRKSTLNKQPPKDVNMSRPRKPYTRRAITAVPHKDSQPTAPDISSHIAYCAGYLTAWLENYARGQQLVVGELAGAVGVILKGGAR